MSEMHTIVSLCMVVNVSVNIKKFSADDVITYCLKSM